MYTKAYHRFLKVLGPDHPRTQGVLNDLYMSSKTKSHLNKEKTKIISIGLIAVYCQMLPCGGQRPPICFLWFVWFLTATTL
jgi:hypothetical protein